MRVKDFLRKYLLVGVGLVVAVGVFFAWQSLPKEDQIIISPKASDFIIEKPLAKYSFMELRQRVFTGSEIEFPKDMKAGEVGVFYFEVEGKRVSGQINWPVGKKPKSGYPVVIMIRGYVDQEIYETGIGTSRAAEVFAKNGYITLALDFMGFGESDDPPNFPLEERFLRPVQVLELIASVKKWGEVDSERINIWGHSNGGQIALSVLEISGGEYPTTLWAPVSKPFPYSIFYYTDEFDDYGKALRKVVAGFEAQYDADLYSIHNYYDLIEAPIQMHQGTNDDAVPVLWSEELAKTLEELEKEVELYVYSGADHNMLGAWSEAVGKDLEWFQ